MCRKNGLADDIATEPYPHPYLVIWLECKRQASYGLAPYPDPTRGWLEQDADLWLGCEVLDELEQQQSKLEQARALLQEQRQQIFGTPTLS